MSIYKGDTLIAGGGISMTLLFDAGVSGVLTSGTKTLNDSIDNYKFLIISGGYIAGGSNYYENTVFAVNNYKEMTGSNAALIYFGGNDWVALQYNGNSSQVYAIGSTTNGFIYKIYGVK